MGGKCHLIVFNFLKPPSIKFRTLYFDGALYGSWFAHKPLINCSQTAHKLPAIDWEACAYLVGIWPWSNWSKPGSIVMLRLFMTLHSRCSYVVHALLLFSPQWARGSSCLILPIEYGILQFDCAFRDLWPAHKLLMNCS